MLGELVVVTAFACLIALAGYLWRVPAGPACPRCGALTRESRRHGGRAHALLSRLSVVAECPVCGWDGRMRRRPPVSVLASYARRRGAR